MNKRLTILELQEGKEYAAFQGDRRLKKTYRINNGRIENRYDGDGDTTTGLGRDEEYTGCDWVPVKANITFEEIGTFESTPTLFTLKDGAVYLMRPDIYEDGTLVARVGGTLYHSTGNGMLGQPVDMAELNVDARFDKVGLVDQVSSYQNNR
jgi:hypothetical protein